ncbi:MAG: SDR family oxidoreductase [Promethearchaeota archaeon]
MSNIVITGSTKGFGLALAKIFLKFGDSVVICSRNEDRVDKALKNLKQLYSNDSVYGVKCDITQKENVENLGQFALENLGSIDIWINNAGISSAGDKPLVDTSEENIRTIINTNLIGTLFGCQVALGIMLKQKFGKIFNLEGLGSDGRVVPNVIPYISTKAAIPMVTKTLTKELKNSNILVNNIHPGMMVTDLILKGMSSESKLINILAELPITVAQKMVPIMKNIKKTGKRIKFSKGSKIFIRFMTSWRFKNRFMDKNGNLLIEIE